MAEEPNQNENAPPAESPQAPAEVKPATKSPDQPGRHMMHFLGPTNEPLLEVAFPSKGVELVEIERENMKQG